jgi:hypothetical protein
MGKGRTGNAGAWSRPAALLLGLAFIVPLALAPRADAFIYWANGSDNTIGRAATDGTAPSQSFIAGATFPRHVAVDGAHIYWANLGTDTIGRANLNGSGANQSFVTGADDPEGVTVDDTYIYWANASGNTIGRAPLANPNGPGKNQSFVTGANLPQGVEVDGAHVYWTNLADGTIGRADLDGVTNKTQSFVAAGASNAQGLTVDETHVYWTFSGTSIARTPLSDPNGPAKNTSFISDANIPIGIALDTAHLYWTNNSSATIGRSSLDGMDVDESFSTTSTNPLGIAVDGLLVPSCQGTSAATALSQPVSVTLSCSSGGGTRTYAIASQPPHGSISDFNASTGRLTYIPDAGFRGTDSFTFRASNPGATSTAAKATLTVTPNPNGFTIGKPKKNKHKGIAVLPVTLPGAGTLQIPPSTKVKGQVVDARSAGEFKIAVRANNKAKKKLKRKGKVKVPVDVLFSPSGGDQAKQDLKVKLKRKRRG